MKRNRPRVLIADDNPEMARTLAEGLSDRGYDTVAAAGGKDAIDLLASDKLDAVVTDMRMPDVDGMAVLAASRRSDPQRPVIVMTAYSAIHSAVESIRQGAYHYLTKPFKLDELTIFLQRALDEYRLRQEVSELRRTLGSEIEQGGPSTELAFRGVVLPFRELQHRYAAWALGQFAGHRGRTAERLGVDGKTLARWLSENGPERPANEEAEPEDDGLISGTR